MINSNINSVVLNSHSKIKMTCEMEKKIKKEIWNLKFEITIVSQIKTILNYNKIDTLLIVFVDSDMWEKEKI